jgi:hypothetical protein
VAEQREDKAVDYYYSTLSRCGSQGMGNFVVWDSGNDSFEHQGAFADITPL